MAGVRELDVMVVVGPQRHGTSWLTSLLVHGCGAEPLGELADLINCMWLGSLNSNGPQFSLDEAFMATDTRVRNISDFVAGAVFQLRQSSDRPITFKYGASSETASGLLRATAGVWASCNYGETCARLATSTWPRAYWLCMLRQPLDAAASAARLLGIHDEGQWKAYWQNYAANHDLMHELNSTGHAFTFFFDDLVADPVASLEVPFAGSSYSLQREAIERARDFWTAPVGDRSLQEAKSSGFRRTGQLPLEGLRHLTDDVRVSVERAWGSRSSEVVW